MNKRITLILAGLLLMGLMANAAMAQSVMTTITPADQSNAITFTADVSEQCQVVTLPTTVAFAVTKIDVVTPGTGFDQVSISDIILGSGNTLKLSLLAKETNFSAGSGAAGTIPATKVSWTATGWSGGTGVDGTPQVLSKTISRLVATSTASTPGTAAVVGTGTTEEPQFPAVEPTAATTALASSGLAFALAPLTTAEVIKAGSFTLAATWKIEGGGA